MLKLMKNNLWGMYETTLSERHYNKCILDFNLPYMITSYTIRPFKILDFSLKINHSLHSPIFTYFMPVNIIFNLSQGFSPSTVNKLD